MSSHPDEAFVAPMMFPPLKYTLKYTRRKPKLACPNPVLNNHAVSPPVVMEAPPVLVMVDNASSADTTIPQNNSIDPHQEAVVALPASSGVMRDPSANPSEGEQLVSTALLGDRTITPTSEPTSIGSSFSNSRDASPIDDPIPPIGDSNKYLEFFGYDTGTDEWPPVLQQPTAYVESTSDHSQTWPAESGAILVSQCDDHVGIVSVHRFASIGWQEHLLLDGTRYFSNATLHVVTDLDLHKSEELDAVTRFLDGPDTEILPPSQWELWLRDGNESRRGFIPVKAWVHHGARMVASKHPGSDLDGHVNEAIDKMESEFEYWQYVVSHPVHALLPPATIAEAVEILTWIYNCWLALSPHHSQLPFSQEECQELLTQLRSFSREPHYSEI
ncbi:hypothetical protein F5148DRAFT_740940 [Russula earlei]|uniref:Uncharacterized protein n=1 Tax=Russula earlei TaxID=71964 RepID=A0ACC0UEN2_9AGAM|nr:hypothetical protein F5148DRAFT_740940 [Russula earlei]